MNQSNGGGGGGRSGHASAQFCVCAHPIHSSGGWCAQCSKAIVRFVEPSLSQANQIANKANQAQREELAKAFYVGLLSSGGRDHTIVNGNKLTLAKGAFYHADMFLGEIEEQKIK